MESIWPLKDRPESLHRDDVVNAIDFTSLLGMAKYHKESTVGASSSGKASFTKDALPASTYFKEGKDDGVKHLHEARWQRLPLSDLKKWWTKVPLTRTHKYRNIPLKHMGCQGQVAEKTIENMHDRSNSHLLKHFLAENIAVNSKPMKKLERKEDDGLSTVFDYTWEEPATLSQVQDAVLNFQAVLYSLWPMDPTAIIILKVLNKYRWISAGDNLNDKVKAASTFFNAVMRDNAGRAVRGELVMSFDEQERLLKDVLVSSGISSTIPIGRIPKTDVQRSIKQPQQSFKNPVAGKTSAGKFQVARVGNLGVCYSYNDNTCKNATKTTAGCKDAQNREFAHNCNRFITSKQVHCLGDHPRHKHVMG